MPLRSVLVSRTYKKSPCSSAGTISSVLHRSRQRVFGPETDFERNGFVPNVVFPTGIVERDDVIHVYYGAADTYTAVAEISRVDVVSALR